MTTTIDGINGVTLDGSLQRLPSEFLGFKNKIINGGFDIWQRGTGASGTITPQNTISYANADRWGHYSFSGDGGAGSGQQAFAIGQTAVPGNPRYFLRKNYSSAPGGGQANGVAQRIESLSRFSGKTMTLSFWAKSGDTNKNMTTECILYFGTGGSPTTTITGIGVSTAALTTSWQFYSTVIEFPDLSGLTLGTGFDDFMELRFWHGGGPSPSIRSNYLVLTGNQGIFDLAQVQLEDGDVATDFEIRSREVEFYLCQRYYQTFVSKWGVINQNTTANVSQVSHPFMVPFRTTPSAAFSGTTQSGIGAVAGFSSNSTSFVHQYTSSAAQTLNSYAGTISASAEYTINGV